MSVFVQLRTYRLFIYRLTIFSRFDVRRMNAKAENYSRETDFSLARNPSFSNVHVRFRGPSETIAIHTSVGRRHEMPSETDFHQKVGFGRHFVHPSISETIDRLLFIRSGSRAAVSERPDVTMRARTFSIYSQLPTSSYARRALISGRVKKHYYSLIRCSWPRRISHAGDSDRRLIGVE